MHNLSPGAQSPRRQQRHRCRVGRIPGRRSHHASSVSVGRLSPPGTDARYTRRPRTTAAAADDPADAASTKNLANSRRKTDKPRIRKRDVTNFCA